MTIIKYSEHTYYVIQHKIAGKSPWLKPDGEIKKAKGKWSKSMSGRFVTLIEKWSGSGNAYKPTNISAYEEMRDVNSKTGSCGWWSLKSAEDGVRILKKANKENRFQYVDAYNKPVQTVRYKFRIVKVYRKIKIEKV